MDLRITTICARCGRSLEHVLATPIPTTMILNVTQCATCSAKGDYQKAKKLLEAAIDAIPKEEMK